MDFSYQKSGPRILRGLNYEFQPGNVYHLQGSNGVGKSTLSKLLAGILHAGSGKVVLNSTDVIDLHRQPGAYFAYHFQNPDYQLFRTTVVEEIRISIAASGLKVEEWLTCFGLTEFSKQHPLELPFVLKKRLAMAATFAMSRPWLILDEPTLGQDSDSVNAIIDLCNSYAQQGGGVIMISHSQELERLAKAKRITLREGQLW